MFDFRAPTVYFFTNDLPGCMMSDKYGYEYDFKLIGMDPITIGLNLREIIKRCDSNFMTQSFARTK